MEIAMTIQGVAAVAVVNQLFLILSETTKVDLPLKLRVQLIRQSINVVM